MLKTTSKAARWLVRATGIICGSVSIVGAARNGLALGVTPFDGITFAAAGSSVVVMSWFLPELASDAWAARAKVKAAAATALWIVTATFTLMQAVGYSAHHRGETVEAKRSAVLGVADARKHLSTAEAELAEMKANERWQQTAACTNATAAKSKAFCDMVAAKGAEIAEARTKASASAPGSVDAQADALAWASGLSAAWIASAMPVIMAIVFELGAGLAFFAASGAAVARSAPVEAAEVPVEIVVEAEALPAIEAPAAVVPVKLARAGTKAYYLRRLEREHPQIAKRVQDGELSVHAASVSAGLRKAPAKSKWASIDSYLGMADA